ncbi:transcriptional regulator, partial [Campylobacter coli]|nr:transcriptional regulator [Campylobacter coli]EIS7807237.1 transcriptional regulator [Campylobacter coli]EIT4356539.1 transcriptional regulator [Campylobacter coli]EJQ2015292.1 transcriptional regulator [Campylobacter coli]EKD6922347.1 transcriptional regulator [Campylobacter coli]
GINQFLDESLKEILNQPLKEKFALTPKGEYFFEGNLSLFQKQCLENNATACAYQEENLQQTRDFLWI